MVLIEGASKEQDDAFLDWIKEHQLGWWHWMRDGWLLIDPKERFSVSDIRDQIKTTHGTLTSMVIEIKGSEDTWAGFGPNKGEKNMFDWLKRTWKDKN